MLRRSSARVSPSVLPPPSTCCTSVSPANDAGTAVGASAAIPGSDRIRTSSSASSVIGHAATDTTAARGKLPPTKSVPWVAVLLETAKPSGKRRLNLGSEMGFDADAGSDGRMVRHGARASRARRDTRSRMLQSVGDRDRTGPRSVRRCGGPLLSPEDCEKLVSS